MEPADKNFINNLNQLGNIYGLDQAEVQRNKDTLYYKFTEFISSIFSGMWGSNSITKAQNILENKVKTPTLEEDQINKKLGLVQEKFPNLKEMINEERKEIKNLLNNLKFEFKTEREMLELAKQKKEEDPASISKHEKRVQSMANKFLEFEEGLRTTNLKTNQALFSHLKDKLEKKFKNIGGLNHGIFISIETTKNFDGLNKAAKLLNTIEVYKKGLIDGFEIQQQKLQQNGISPSIQQKIKDQQSQSLEEAFLLVKDKNDISVLDKQYTDLLFTWSNDVVLEMAYEYVVKEHQAVVDQTLGQLENPKLKEFVKNSADQLFTEANLKPEAKQKIHHLDWMETQLVNDMQTFLKQEVDRLDPLLDTFSDKLSKELGLDPEKWKADVKNALNQKINEVKDAVTANALLNEIAELNDFEKLNLLLNPMEQIDILDKQTNFEVKVLEKKFPKRRTDQLLGFLGNLGKETLLEQISQKLVLASKATSLEDKQKLIADINSIKEEKIVEELKVKIREKDQEITQQKDKDIEQMRQRHDSLLSNYPWIADEKEGSSLLEQYTIPFNSFTTPSIKDLDLYKDLLRVMTYTEMQLISTESNVQRDFAAKKKVGSENYSIRFQQQIANKLKDALLPVYQEVTKEAQNNEENITAFNEFIKNKTREIATEILQSPAGIEKYKDLKANKDLENELRESFKSTWDTLNDWFS